MVDLGVFKSVVNYYTVEVKVVSMSRKSTFLFLRFRLLMIISGLKYLYLKV